jgi:hypothetical protein
VTPSQLSASTCAALQAQGEDGRQIQGEAPRLLNLMPPFAKPPQPLLLLDPAFGRARDGMFGHGGVTLRGEDYAAADALVTASSRFYQRESERCAAVGAVLGSYLADVGCRVQQQKDMGVGLSRPDLSVVCCQVGAGQQRLAPCIAPARRRQTRLPERPSPPPPAAFSTRLPTPTRLPLCRP